MGRELTNTADRDAIVAAIGAATPTVAGFLSAIDKQAMGLNALSFAGVDPTGATFSDDGWDNFTAACALHKVWKIPAGLYKFSRPVQFPVVDDVVLMGDGAYCTKLVYEGAGTALDCFTFGPASGYFGRWLVKGIRFASNTTMTAGRGVHVRGCVRSRFVDVDVDGQDGTGKFFHGIWWDRIDQVVWDKFEARAQRDAVQVSGEAGAGAKADIYLSGGYKISSSAVGIRCGGAFGGLALHDGAIAVCGNSLVIDNTLVAEANREVFVHSGCVIDAGTGDAAIVIDQSIPANMAVIITPQWLCSQAGHAVWVKNGNGARVVIKSYIYNLTSGGDGVRVSDPACIVDVTGTMFANIAGWCVNPTVDNTHIIVASSRNATGGGLGFINPAHPLTDMVRTSRTLVDRIALDANAYQQLNALGMPQMVFDANDWMEYNRALNTLDVWIGGNLVFRLSATNIALPGVTMAGSMIISPDLNSILNIGRFSAAYGGAALNANGGATFLSLQLAGAEKARVDGNGLATPQVTFDAAAFKRVISNTPQDVFDAGDWMEYNRALNTLDLWINSVLTTRTSGAGTLYGGAWNSSHIMLGANHLWADASGRLRIKSSAPSSDTDGTVVGTQS